MIKPSEFQILLLAVTLAPLAVGMYRAIRWPGRTWLAVTLAAMLVSYVSTVVEGFVAETFFNLVEHLSLAVAGVAFAMTTAGLLRTVRVPEDAER